VAIASLVLGIVAILSALIPLGFYLALPVAILAIVLGVLARKSLLQSGEPTATATTGMVLGVIGFLLAAAMWVLCASLWQKVKTSVDTLEKSAAQQRAAEAAKLRAGQSTEEGIKQTIGDGQRTAAPPSAAPPSAAPSAPSAAPSGGLPPLPGAAPAPATP
jgi:ABC-type nickel/cobalt efflux system permease component RcnA